MSDKGYRQILHASFVMGGAQALGYLVSLLRVKAVALLLGPGGVGLLGLYTAMLGLLRTVSGLGLSHSGVRQMAQASAGGDAVCLARTASVLRRACLGTGLLGWLLTAVFCEPLSRWMLQSAEHAWATALLGAALLLEGVAVGEQALLQGVRRIGDLARANLLCLVAGSAQSIAWYAWLGQAGIVPALLVSALVSLAVTRYYSRRIALVPLRVGGHETLHGARAMARLGLAFMWSAALSAGLDMFLRAFITRELGLAHTGMFQAAWSLSALFAGLVFGAMGADFYPRLAGVIHDHEAAAQNVNEQTEVGLLLSLPGLVALIVFSPWILTLFYTSEFTAAAAMLSWMALGVFGRVISWPLGFVLVAKGAARWFVISDTFFIALQAGLTVIFVREYGLPGSGWAFAATYAAHVLGMRWAAGLHIGFRWTPEARHLLLKSSAVVFCALAVSQWGTPRMQIPLGLLLTILASLVSLRGLGQRLGGGHRLFKLIHALPGARRLTGLNP